jgi:hypothetical protein
MLLYNKECGVSIIVFILHVLDSSVDEEIWRIRKTLADLIYSIQMYQVNLLTVFRFIVHHYSLTNWLFCFTYAVIHYTMVNGYCALIVHLWWTASHDMSLHHSLLRWKVIRWSKYSTGLGGTNTSQSIDNCFWVLESITDIYYLNTTEVYYLYCGIDSISKSNPTPPSSERKTCHAG